MEKRSTRIEKTCPTVRVNKTLARYSKVRTECLDIVAESGLSSSCAYGAGESTYSISCVSPPSAHTQPHNTPSSTLHFFVVAFWRGVEGVGDVFNALGVVCGCVN